MQRTTDLSDQALRSLLAGSYVVLDTETTGLVAPEMVSVAVVDSTGKTMIDALVRPRKPIEPGASEITGLTEAGLAHQPEFPAIERDLSRILQGRTVVIYNAQYDLAVLRNTYARYELPLPTFTPWCAMRWFAEVHGEWDERRRSYRWQSLSKAALSCGLKQPIPHTALGDSLTTWRLLQAMAARMLST
ncbi:MAG TPA: 3'-5' exonuclease [Candidatus Acetothermia bacterium]|nr:3'-5' exonuclease [Candidatus Acetothermia bacterium]